METLSIRVIILLKILRSPPLASLIIGLLLSLYGSFSRASINEQGNVSAYMLELLNTMNKKSGGISAPVEECSNCRTRPSPLSRIKYETCNAQNNYLENQMEREIKKGSLIGKIINYKLVEKNINPQCTRLGMEAHFKPQSPVYKTCSGNSVRRSCISENYFKMIHNSFEVAATCMEDFLGNTDTTEKQKDIRSVYALINVESGFHINAKSPTGAGGIGQLTYSSIADVNANSYGILQKKLRNHSNPTCRALSREVLKTPLSAVNSCQRSSIEQGNPLKNMVYTFSYVRLLKSYLENLVLKKYSNAFSHLSREEMKEVTRVLSTWSHNVGPGGMATSLKMLLATKYRFKKVESVPDFLMEVEKALFKAPARANRSFARRKETKNYYPKIQNTLNNIESGLGGKFSCISQ